MTAFVEWLTEPYWRVRWWYWFLMRSPLISRETTENYKIMEQRWETQEPMRGVPPSVRKHRAGLK